MKQQKNTMEMIFKIHSPYVIIKDRPHLEHELEVDLGEITITYDEAMIPSRFNKVPKKTVLQSTFIIDCKDVSIRYSVDQFIVAPKFDLKLDFSYLSGTNMLHCIDSHQLDKSFRVKMMFAPQLHLKLREDVYTFILRVIDLNFGYTDYLEDHFVFKNEEDYFRSTDYLVKSETLI